MCGVVCGGVTDVQGADMVGAEVEGADVDDADVSGAAAALCTP